MLTDVLGVLVIARNGGRYEFHQDSKNYEPAFVASTPLGVSESHQLGSLLRSVYLTSSSPSYISSMNGDIVDTHELHIHAKAGGEGAVIFDSAIALLQGLYPPNKNNKILLANGTTVVSPLSGYQYVPIETVEPGNDRSLEPWTNCPFKNGTDNFQIYHAFGHKADIPLTEFIYRIEVGHSLLYSHPFTHWHFAPQNYAITSQKQWAAACSVGYHDPYLHIGSQQGASSTVFAACAAILFVGVFALAKYIKRSRAKKQYIHLADDEVSLGFDHENYNYGTTTANVDWPRREFELYD
ncbi:hypothetical protein JVT61DRAFT_718 [Boletus reticuloceps]|uniref:Uncharacterized protein n=1 Tax=Boletus reticuloceps TaxID=495285 RepID=A0A8I2Z1K2_9AGAM|nr:hypothetical protein JVT61DRAFT_718 [Boletus reticuloceps]